jgi:hypothetical protein
MGGGLMQLVAYGAQDVYLTGRPEVTFFKNVYKRHTNFSIEAIPQVFNGNPTFDQNATVALQRNGDLIKNMYLTTRLSALDAGDDVSKKVAWVDCPGHAILAQAELLIGGSRIDRQHGDWLNFWNGLTLPVGQVRGYNQMVGKTVESNSLSNKHQAYQIHTPLQFSHCRHAGLALPLIALQYHAVRVDFKFNSKNTCLVSTSNVNLNEVSAVMENTQLLVDFIYLDARERKRFAQASHEYLIEQVQHTNKEAVNSNSVKIKLDYNHPSKFLVWGLKLGKYTTGQCFLAYNSNNWEVARDLATKRFILNVAARTDSTGTAEVSAGDFLFVHNGAAIDGVLHTPVGLTGTALVIWNKITANQTQLPRLIDDSDNKVRDDTAPGGPFMVMDNVLYNEPMPKEYMSMIVENVFSGVVSKLTNSEVEDDIDVCVHQYCNYGMHLDGQWNPVTQGCLSLNGHDRFAARDGQYFNYVQPYQHFPNTPPDGHNSYSFALKPHEHQPSGSVNFSRIDATQLSLDFGVPPGETLSFKNDYIDDNTNLYIFTMNYNVLRIMSGMGGLAYSN